MRKGSECGGCIMTLNGFSKSNVIRFARHGKAMKFPQISEVRTYWEALRDGRAAPFRSELDPRGIEGALDCAFVLERIAPQLARFRLAGQHLGDLMGMEVRGMPLTSLCAPSARKEMSDALEAVFSGPRVAEMTLVAETSPSRPPLSARLLILPLRSDLGDMSRALGCLVAEGPIGRAPRRFGIRSATLSAIPVVAGGVARHQPARDTAGFAEPPARFSGAPAKRSRAHLRLVVSDD